MLSLFASYCRNQQFMRQIIRKPFTSFCLSNQNIQQHINTLIELRGKYQVRDEIEKDEQIKLEISKYENDLDSYLTKFMVHQREPYYQFRKHLIQLAYKTYFINKTMSIKYIESAMCGDFQNYYKEEWMKQLFLAELYGIKFRINYHGKEEEYALKSLTHWQNVVENHCLFYKQWKENGSFDINAFTQNMEVVYYEQYLQCLVAVIRLFQVYGDFEKSKTYFEEFGTKIVEADKIVEYFKEQLNEMEGEQQKKYQQFIEHYEIQFFQYFVSSFIPQIKISIWEKDFEEALSILQQLYKSKYINEVQSIQLFMLEYDLVLLSGCNYQFLEQIKHVIEKYFRRLKYKHNSEYFLCFHELLQFQYKYTLVQKDKPEQLQMIMKFDQFRQTMIEFNYFRIEQFILNKNFSEVLQLCLESIYFLKQNQQFKHYFWDSFIFSTLLAAYRVNGAEDLQKHLVYIQKKILLKIDRPLQKIIEFFELILELERNYDNNKINQDLLRKINLLEFEQFFIQYQKQLVLEKIYKKYNLKKELDECYENQIKILSQNKDLYWQNLEEIYMLQKIIKV